MKVFLATVSILLGLFGCSDNSIPPEEFTKQGWFTTDNGNLIAKTLVKHHVYACNYFRFKTMTKKRFKDNGTIPNNADKLWVQCATEARVWDRNFVLWPSILELESVTNQENIINYL
jgi:hypothetical protein